MLSVTNQIMRNKYPSNLIRLAPLATETTENQSASRRCLGALTPTGYLIVAVSHQTSNHWQCFCSLQIGKSRKHQGQIYASESKLQKSRNYRLFLPVKSNVFIYWRRNIHLGIKQVIGFKRCPRNVYVCVCVVSCNYSEL